MVEKFFFFFDVGILFGLEVNRVDCFECLVVDEECLLVVSGKFCVGFKVNFSG